MFSSVISNLCSSRMGRIFLHEILRKIMLEISHSLLQVLKCLTKIGCEYIYIIMQYED